MGLLPERFSPGEYIQDELNARGWSREDLASIMGRSEQHVNGLLDGSLVIDQDIALELARAFGTSSEMWIKLQASAT